MKRPEPQLVGICAPGATYGQSRELIEAYNRTATLNGQGRYEEAEPHFTRALAIREKALGPEHPDVAASLNNLAALYRNQGRYAEAEPLYERATVRPASGSPPR